MRISDWSSDVCSSDLCRVLCAAPDYLRRHGAPQTPEDLARHECILLSGSQGRRDTWRLSDRQGRESVVHVQGRLESNFGEVVRDAAVAGLGIARHSTWHVRSAEHTSELQSLMRITYAVFCLQTKTRKRHDNTT